MCVRHLYTIFKNIQFNQKAEYAQPILPSVRTLQRLSRYQNVDPNDSASNMNYLRMIEINLTNEEKFIEDLRRYVLAAVDSLQIIGRNNISHKHFMLNQPSVTHIFSSFG